VQNASSGSARDGVLVSVLVPVLDEMERIHETSAAMLAQRVEGAFELIFADGGSSDGTREWLEELQAADARVRVLSNPARHVPGGLNVGLRAARGEFVARMDAHTWYPDCYLQRGIERLRAGGVEWVSGPAIAHGTGRWSRRVAIALGTPLGQGGSRKWSDAPGAAAGPAEVELDTGVFCGVWRHATLRRLRGWDEQWIVNEDAEMAARVMEAGGRIVCLAELGARYAPRESLSALWRQYWRFGFYRVRTAARHPVALRRSHLLPIGLTLTSGVALAGSTRPARAARACLALYALGLAGASLRTRPAARWPDVASLPLVLATMHLSWGLGFVAGCLRTGPPLRAFARLCRPY
jgi:succinoglycan biosynthesis protein ExoA